MITKMINIYGLSTGIKKIKSSIYFLKHVNLIKSNLTRLKIKNKNIIIYKNLHCFIDKTAQITIKGILRLGCQWKHGKYFPSQFIMRENAKMIVMGRFNIYTNCKIWLNENSELKLGSGNINNGFNMSCFQKIEIGDNVSIAENVTIRDSDNHYTNNNSLGTAPIKIGDKVWIGMNATILKGVTIGDGAVIAAGSVVNRDIPSRCLAAGVPAVIKKRSINWSKSADIK